MFIPTVTPPRSSRIRLHDLRQAPCFSPVLSQGTGSPDAHGFRKRAAADSRPLSYDTTEVFATPSPARPIELSMTAITKGDRIIRRRVPMISALEQVGRQTTTSTVDPRLALADTAENTRSVTSPDLSRDTAPILRRSSGDDIA